MATVPLVAVAVVTVNVSPSASLSLPNTLIAADGVSSLVVTVVSATATGASFTAVTVIVVLFEGETFPATSVVVNGTTTAPLKFDEGLNIKPVACAGVNS